MEQRIEQWRAERRSFSATLREIRQAVDGLDACLFSGVRHGTDDLRAFVAGIVVSPATRLRAADEATLLRLSAKLEALSERLLYSDFGPAQLQSLEAVITDLDAIIERHLLGEEEVPLALAEAAVGEAPRQEILTG
jgi:hypothetical protein